MEEISKEERKIEEEEEKEELITSSRGTNNNLIISSSNIFQKPYDFIEEVIRVILRCLGFEDAIHHSSQHCASEPTTTTSSDGDGDDADADEKTCPPPTEIPDLDVGSCDLGGGGGGGDGDDSAKETEPVDGSQPPAVAIKSISKRPPRPGVSSGKPPQHN
ncbi:uncharacterized protein LOC141586942 [Silene latifolia]|uniref:uncharacterized protein LOC141586942 n=1 Tax=Silene latifolia TaxID=37657 RepID=UPI003D780575